MSKGWPEGGAHRNASLLTPSLSVVAGPEGVRITPANGFQSSPDARLHAMESRQPFGDAFRELNYFLYVQLGARRFAALIDDNAC